MTRVLMSAVIVVAFTLGACGDDTPQKPTRGQDAPFLVMDESLDQLKADFNAASGSVRLVFISGPTCGICLRGMADLNASILGGNRDPRLKTFVIHVPTLNAAEQDARNSTPLIDNPHTRHYWENTGIVGQHYQEVLNIDYYAWDVWMIYGPDARWEGTLPPRPEFWMHQLGPLPDDLYLDASAFAEKAREMLSDLPEAPVEAGAARTAAHQAPPVKVENVAQPRGVPLQQHVSGRGGYRNLAAVQSVRREGVLVASGTTRPLIENADANGRIERRVGSGDTGTTALRENGSLVPPGRESNRGLAWPLEAMLLSSRDLTSPLVDWKAKGHEVGGKVEMVRVGQRMAWKLDVRLQSGQMLHSYIDSHTGMELQRDLLDSNGRLKLSIRYGDFRVAEPDTPYPSRFPGLARKTRGALYQYPGYVFPYRVEFHDPTGQLLATEQWHFIDVDYEGESS